MILVWLRRDLRTFDNTALNNAIASGEPVVAAYIATPQQWRSHHMSARQADLIARRIPLLAKELQQLNIPLLYAEVSDYQASAEQIARWSQALACSAVYANEEYEVNECQRDARLAELVAAKSVHCRFFADKCALPPGAVLNKAGDFFKVFTPFKRAWLSQFSLPHIEKPQAAVAFQLPPGLPVVQEETQLVFSYPRQSSTRWPAHTEAILNALRDYCINSVSQYASQRDFPAIAGTSQLSPYLAIGALSVRQCIARLYYSAAEQGLNEGQQIWLSELIWREFYQHLLVMRPDLVKGRAFIDWETRIPWSYDKERLQQWQQGKTGYPIVDAAMQQLNQTGWMHNRLRMIVASFLTKDLHIDWRFGEQYFMQQLIDGDFAANNGGWQWSASTGCDGQPYFRIFNPVSQGEKFDPQGEFVRHWLPALAQVPNKYVHQPWLWSDFATLDYPPPVVDHKEQRGITLQMFKQAKENRA